MARIHQLRAVANKCAAGECPTVYVDDADVNVMAVQGDAVEVPDELANPEMVAVEVPRTLLLELLELHRSRTST